MIETEVKINYLYNSGFILETANHILIFDYYLDSSDKEEKRRGNGTIGMGDLKPEKTILVFASHSHGDHFNPIILDWCRERGNIKYIFSSDIKVEAEADFINYISPYEEMCLEDVFIRAYGSTDIGVSFAVKVDGLRLFHAGDLNWWHWYDESDENNRAAEIGFKAEIEKLQEGGEQFELAFFPVDKRLKEFNYLGGEYFINKLSPKIFIPMHFREDFEVTSEFAKRMHGTTTRIVEISSRGQEFNINNKGERE